MNDIQATIRLLDKSQFYYIICADMDGNYSYINRNYAHTFRHITDSFVGKPYYITMHPDDRQICEAVSARCFAHPGSLFPAVIRKADGKGGFVITQWEYQAMFNDAGEPIGVFCLGYDVTELIDEIDKKDTILKTIAYQQSHIIRKPLANIMGIVAILEKAGLDPDTQKLCDMLLQNAEQLDQVIRGIVLKTHE